ncbi:MAG TPA: mechanosensitive ion channel domain-containing protein [Steroidobacteraceae bacterium]|nr:mechanosensitive ion channel domain-containing protein [Steroidobacteraceae bacterium]
MSRKVSIALLALLLVSAIAAWWQTAPPSPKAVARRTAAVTSSALVDESAYATAQRLAQLATTAQEQPLAATALRVADHELALAFTAALRDVEAHPPTLSPEALKIQDRLQKSQALLDGDQQRVAQLTADLAQAKPSQKDALQDELDLAKSQLDLDKDEVEEADQDLVAAGGNPQQRIEAMVQEHDAQVKARASGAAPSGEVAAPAAGPHGAWMEFRDWLKIRQKSQQLAAAQEAARGKAEALAQQRVALATSLENAKGGISELAQHTKSAKAGAAAATAAGPPIPHSHEDAAALLGRTKLIAADQRVLTLLDRQAADLRQLSGVYQQWSGVVALQSSAVLHKLLLDAAIVVGILLVLLIVDQWAQRLLRNPKLDRRQVETLRSITRVSLRVIAAVVILLIVIGMPSQFGTMIGIVGAGLTVALKDFIVAFFGWLVLMGRNGIRLGDWVEINGVSGEVTELGMFHTVLLETGNWSNAGHPTGRRVTFTNSFAIEGHYFNFSTSGQWLWDELTVVVPAGRDPYPIVEDITKQVAEATAESARLAEQEWQRAVPSQRGKSFSGTPGVSVKPVVGGVEIAVRYLTRAQERFQLRATLYQAAVHLLGQRAVNAAAPSGTNG